MEISLREFESDFGKSALVEYMEIRSPRSEDVFVKRLYCVLNEIISGIESSPKERQKDGEDRITVEIVQTLRGYGYFATKDQTQGGHVDIHVSVAKNRNMIWYGEAKIWDGCEYIEKGLTQLMTRYATGRQKHLGVLIYFKDRGIVEKLKDWMASIETKSLHGFLNVSALNDFTLESEHMHKSGARVLVRHFGINIDWSPE